MQGKWLETLRGRKGAVQKAQKARYFLCFLMLGMLCYYEVMALKAYLDTSKYQMHYLEYVFYVVFLGCNMPFSTVLFLLICTKENGEKRIWASAAHGLFMALLMAASVLLLSLVLSLFVGTKGAGWTEPALMQQGKIDKAMVPLAISSAMMPAAAIARSAIIIVLYWFAASLFLLLFQVLEHLEIGAGLFMLFHFGRYVFMYDVYPSFLPDARYSYGAIIALSAQGKEAGEYTYSIYFFLSIIICLIAVIVTAAHFKKKRQLALIK